MNDDLLKYIRENKSEMDLFTPPNHTFEQVEMELKKKQRVKRLIPFFASVAAVLLLIVLVPNLFENNSNSELVELETSSDFETSTDSTPRISRTEDIHWYNNQLITYRNKDKSPTVSTNSDGLGVTYNIGDIAYANACYSIATDRGRINTHDYVADGEDRILQYEVDRYYEQYDKFDENKFETPLAKPLSTFGIDVDGAAYSNVRRFIQAGYLPPKDAVKIEEMVNYFNYDFTEPKSNEPFSITTEVSECPWKENNVLMEVGLKAKSIEMGEEQANNLVFLVDVSGSMDQPNKLPLLKKSLRLLVNQMQEDDFITIVTYAGASGLALPTTSGANKEAILDAIEKMTAGGSTAGEAGINLAYHMATQSFLEDGNNRVILATDGDFNVGVSNDYELTELIKKKKKSGVYLSVLGFGTGNLQSSKMEKLADNGNGNYYYLDNLNEAKKVLVDELGGTLVTVADDVKLQIEFNPEKVKSYRLLGYENRLLKEKDFDDDEKDAGDLGAGHSVIALYELELMDSLEIHSSNDLRYQKKQKNPSKKINEELAVVSCRYKNPGETKSKLMECIIDSEIQMELPGDIGFASAVAEFALLLRESDYRGNASFDAVIERAQRYKGRDIHGYRAEFIELVKRAKILMMEYQLKKEI